MKKLFAIFIILMLLLTSCNSTPADEIALADTDEPMSQTEDTAPTKPSEEAQADTKPPVTTEDETQTDRIEGQWQESGNGLDGDTVHKVKENEEEIIIDGYVIHNDGLIPKEMTNRDYRYELGYCGFSPGTLASLLERSELVVIATPKTTFDEGERLLKNADSAEVTDFNTANMASSYTKRAFTVKKVLKGEATDEINVLERAIAEGIKMRIVEGEFICDKDEEYLLFLYKSGNSDAYLTPQGAGKYYTQNTIYNGESNLYKEVFDEYKEYFKQ